MPNHPSGLINKSLFKYFHPISTRWADNDVYGHVNNVTYYSYFDTAVNHYLINQCGLDIHSGGIIAYVVSSNCDYLRPIAFPEELTVGVGVKRLGNSSVTYQVATFTGSEDEASAHGEFVHVFVSRESQQSVNIPLAVKEGLERIVL